MSCIVFVCFFSVGEGTHQKRESQSPMIKSLCCWCCLIDSEAFLLFVCKGRGLKNLYKKKLKNGVRLLQDVFVVFVYSN